MGPEPPTKWHLDDWRISTWEFTSNFITRTAIAMRGLVIKLRIWRTETYQLCMGPLPPSVGGSDKTSISTISTSECTSQCWNIYFQPEIPDKNIRRGFNHLKINNARLHISNLQIFRQSRSLNCRAGLLHWNHSFLLCVYNIQQKRKSVKGFCEKNAKIFSGCQRRKNLQWRKRMTDIHLMRWEHTDVHRTCTNDCATCTKTARKTAKRLLRETEIAYWQIPPGRLW